MHEYRFIVPPGHALPDDVHERLFLADFFGDATPCEGSWEGSVLRVLANEASGYFQLPNVLPDGSERMMKTATLVARTEPYILPLELARGIVHRMSNRFWEWRLAGIDMTERFGDSLTSARSAFSRALAKKHDTSQRGESSLQAFQQARALMANMSHWMSEFIVDRQGEIASRERTLMIGRLPTKQMNRSVEVEFAKSFDTGAIPLSWKNVQPTPDVFDFASVDAQLSWCVSRNLNTIVGPIIDLHSGQVPDWLLAMKGDGQGVSDAALRWVEEVVERYSGNVTMWHAASGLAGPQGLELDIYGRLELAVETLARIRKLDDAAPIALSFDQPFGEYHAAYAKMAPSSFVATLIDNRIVPDAVGLELQFDIWPGGSVRRDPVDLFRSLDPWSDLEVPLLVFLSAPSAHASNGSRATSSRVTHQQPSESSQSRVITDLAALLIAHPAVHGVCWNECLDSDPYRFANSGLWTADDRPKLALETWRSLLSFASGG